VTTPHPEGSRREQQIEAGVFALAACGFLVFLGFVSLMEGWTLVGVSGWVWFLLAAPEILLVIAFARDASRAIDVGVIAVVVSANLCGLALLITSLVTETSAKLSGGQLLLSGAVFWFPQDDNDRLHHTGWHPRLEDYTYIALTNGIAFSPTDAMPLTRKAKSLMSLDAIISVGAVLLVAARAVNVLGA
jgi:hypothetical protein